MFSLLTLDIFVISAFQEARRKPRIKRKTLNRLLSFTSMRLKEKVSHIEEWGYINSLAPGRFQWNLRKIIFRLILVTDGCDISSEIALRWTSLDLSDDKSTLVQVMAWCCQATSHYLNQCWPRSLSPYGVTRSQWVNTLFPERSKTAVMWNVWFGCIFSWLISKAFRADSRLALSQRETLLQCNAISHRLGANLESVLSVSIVLVQVMDWCRQSLPEPMLTKFCVAIWRLSGLSPFDAETKIFQEN